MCFSCSCCEVKAPPQKPYLSRHFIKIALMREEHYCYPVGMFLGAVGGFGNEYLRQKEDYSSYSGVGQSEFDDDI